jgi:Tfp pilus assembly protein PilV
MRSFKKIRTERSCESGFMLLELLISMVVLSVGLGGIMILLVSALYTDNRSSGDTTATMIGEHVIEQISAQQAGSPNLMPFTDCAGTLWNINAVGANIGAGTGANGGNGANLRAAVGPSLEPAGTIDWTQAYAAVPGGYKMQYVACGAGNRQTTYDVRWNVITMPTMSPNAQMIVLSARPMPSAPSGALQGVRFVYPVNLRTIQGM